MSYNEMEVYHNTSKVMKRYPYEKDPKLNRKDSQAKVRRALNFARRVGLEAEVTHKQLSVYFGSHQRPLGRWLRHHLVGIKRDYFNGSGEGSCRVLQELPEGRAHVQRILKLYTKGNTVGRGEGGEGGGGIVIHSTKELYHNISKGPSESGELDCITIPPPPSPLLVELKNLFLTGSVSKKDYQQILLEANTRNFAYREVQGRLLHPLQSVPRGSLNEVMRHLELRWDYDLETCQPSALYSYCRLKGGSASLLAPLKHFLDNKHLYRQLVMDALSVPEAEAKGFLTGLFFNSTISASPRCKAYQRYGPKVLELRQESLIDLLIRCLQRLWRHLQLHLGRSLRKAKDKAAVATALERQCLNAVIKELQRRGEPYFLMHDGWRTNTEIDAVVFEDAIRSATGFEMRVKREFK